MYNHYDNIISFRRTGMNDVLGVLSAYMMSHPIGLTIFLIILGFGLAGGCFLVYKMVAPCGILEYLRDVKANCPCLHTYSTVTNNPPAANPNATFHTRNPDDDLPEADSDPTCNVNVVGNPPVEGQAGSSTDV